MRIGLVAMCGVRVHSPRLMQLGLTLPGFIDRAEVIASMPSLGLLTIAAHLSDHHALTYVEVDSLDDFDVADHNFDLVAFSSFTARAYDMYVVADMFRKSGCIVILGGLHVSQRPDEALEHADAIIVGEGELSFSQAIADVENKQLKRRYFGQSFNLEASRTPRYDLLEAGRYNRMPVQTTRGCPLACDFCGASRLISPYKKKSILHVERDLAAAKTYAQHPFVELADDNTLVDKAWSKTLVETIGLADVKWFTETDISVADDPELLDLLAQSGCRQLLIGLESPQRDGLVNLDRGGWKLSRFDGYRRAIEAIQSRGISVNGCFIVGLDTQGPEVFEHIDRFVEDSELTEVQVTVQTPFPGTALYERLLAQGRLLNPTAWEKCTLFDVNYQPAQMSVTELESGLEHLMTSLYTSSRRSERKRLHARNVRQRRSSPPVVS